MNKNLSKIHLDTWRLFITSHAKIINRIDRDLQDAGQIPLHWYDVLIELVEAPQKRLRMADLAERVVLSRSGLTRLVDKLEANNYLMREIDPEDRRGFYAVLTSAGEEAVRSAWRIYRQSIQAYFAQFLDEDDAVQLHHIFTAMIENIDAD